MRDNKIVRIVINAVICIVVWALLDWIIALIGKKTFTFGVWDNLVYPIIAGVIWGLVDPLGKNKKKED